MNSIPLTVLVFLSGGFVTPVASAQQLIFVDAGATGLNHGASWIDAYTDLQDALHIAQYGDEVWVASGVYKAVVPANPPTVTVPELATSFRINNGVALYGGFLGNEANRDERDIEAHPTILSGDLLDNDNDNIDRTEPTRSDNTWRILLMGNVLLGSVDSTTVLDGFTVSGGNANPPPLNPANSGGGVYVSSIETEASNPLIQNVRFEANSAYFGGGLGCVFANPLLTNVDFINNSASDDGGGMSTFLCAARLRDVRFRENTAGFFGGGLINNRGGSWVLATSFTGNVAEWGGGVYNLLDRSLFVNTFFASNTATVSGGGMYNDESPTTTMNAVFTGNRTLDGSLHGGGGMSNFREIPYMTNTVFYGNSSAGDGGAIHNLSSEPFVINSILWGNHADGQEDEMFSGGRIGGSPLVGASIIRGGVPPSAVDVGGNLEADPLFVDPDGLDHIPGTLDDNFRLLPGSPAIDNGINSALVFDVFDLDDDGDLGEFTPIDLDGNERVYDGNGSFRVDMGAFEFGAPSIIVAIETDLAELPVAPVLIDAYPNPFRDRATLSFEVPTPGHVVLKVYDMLGREVASIVDSELPAGEHEARFFGLDLASGLYLFHLDIAGNRVTKMMMLIN